MSPIIRHEDFEIETLCQYGLFQTFKLPLTQATWLYEFFAQAGILLRLIPINESQALLRTGIVELDNAAHIERLQQTVHQALEFFKRHSHGSL